MFLKAAIVVILSLSVALAWQAFKVQGLEKALIVATVKQEAAETTARSIKMDKNIIESQLERFVIKSIAMEKERNEARAAVDKMRDLFQDHDFAKLITKKPGLIESRMIKKTEEVFNEIETLTAP